MIKKEALYVCLALIGVSALGGCKPKPIQMQQIPRVATNQIPKVRFQQIFLTFKEINPEQMRSKKETEALAKRLFEELSKNPSNFPDAVRKHSEDPFPAVYTLVNYGQSTSEGERERDDFYPGVGLRVFEMKLAEVALVNYDKESSPAGYHLLMRLPL